VVKLKQLVLLFTEDTSFMKQEGYESVDFLQVTKVITLSGISSRFITMKIHDHTDPAYSRDTSGMPRFYFLIR